MHQPWLCSLYETMGRLLRGDDHPGTVYANTYHLYDNPGTMHANTYYPGMGKLYHVRMRMCVCNSFLIDLAQDTPATCTIHDCHTLPHTVPHMLALAPRRRERKGADGHPLLMLRLLMTLLDCPLTAHRLLFVRSLLASARCLCPLCGIVSPATHPTTTVKSPGPTRTVTRRMGCCPTCLVLRRPCHGSRLHL